MATLKELLAEVSTDDVVDAVESAYPDEHAAAGYRKVIGELRATAADPALAEGLDAILVSRCEADDLSPEPYWDVSGLAPDGERFGIDFMPRAAWLCLEVRIEDCDLSPAQMVAHVLWEMTFHGFDEAEVQERNAEICGAVDELEAILDAMPADASDEELSALGLTRFNPEDFGLDDDE